MSTEQITEILKKCEIFGDLSDKELRSIAQLGQIEIFEPGDTIHKQGSLGTKLYILSKGQVSLERKVDLGNSRQGNITVFVLRERPNRRLMGGWSTLVGKEHVQMCSAVCNTPTQVVSIPCSDLKTVLNENSEIRIKILEKLVLLLRDRIDSSYGAIETI
ncbi:cyclic nucleotide-binding domain-containing protein [Thermodesulfobacteriota bacterium]